MTLGILTSIGGFIDAGAIATAAGGEEFRCRKPIPGQVVTDAATGGQYRPGGGIGQ
jgi:hypothetical protein